MSACTFNKPAAKLFVESSLVFQESQYFLYVDQNVTIPPTGIPKDTLNCSVTPELPTGLTISQLCVIQGSASTEASLQKYQITALTNNSSQIFEIWIEVKSQLPFDGFSYPQSYYKINAPMQVSVIPNYVSGKPQQCFVQPALPLSLNLNSDCSITGNTFQAFAKKKYTIVGISANKTVTQHLELEVELNGITSGLLWYFDANLPMIQKARERVCDRGTSSTWIWENIISNSIVSGVFEMHDEYPTKIPCNNTSGWYGNGQPDNPYRWRSDGDVLFIEQKNEYFSDFSLSFWARAISDEVSFISSYESDKTSQRSEANYASDSYDVLFEIYSKKTPLVQWNNGLTYPGLFVYDNYPGFGQARSSQGALIKATSWYAPQQEWHHYTLTQNYAANILKIYIDGIEIKSTAVVYKAMGTGSSNISVAMSDRENYVLGGKGISEFSQIKLFNKTLTATQVLEECESHKSTLYGTSCNNNVKSYYIDLRPVPINTCVAYPLTLTNLDGAALPVGQDVIFDLELPNGVSVSENSDCSNPKAFFTYAANQTSKQIYFFSNEVSTKNVIFKPRDFSSPRTLSLVTTEVPHHLSISGPLQFAYCVNEELDISILDASGQLAALAADATGTVTITPSAGSPSVVNFDAKTGDKQITVYFPGESGYGDGTYTVSIPGVGIDASSTYTTDNCD